MPKSRWPYIKALKGKGRRVIKNVRAFDIETDGLGGEFIAVGWSGDTPDMVNFSDDWEHFVFEVFLQDRTSLWTAHNLGGYESLYFFQEDIARELRERGWTAKTIGPKGKPCLMIFEHEESGDEVRVWDSYSLIRMTLKKATELFNNVYVKQAGEIDFDNEVFDLRNDRHREYLRYDVLSLQELTETFRQYFIETFGVEPGYSLPSSGVRAWRHTLPDDAIYRNITNRSEEQIRNAYKGGRVIVKDCQIHDAIDKYDFNSMYPAVMREFGVPTGPDAWDNKPVEGKPGFVHVIVDVPDDTPAHRCVLADDKRRYPTGVFECWCSTKELEQAIEWGTRVVKFVEGIYFDALSRVFTGFVDLCEQLRATAKKDNKKPLDKLVKLVQNSLYGKFGQKREVESIEIGDHAFGEGFPVETVSGFSDSVYQTTNETSTNQIMPHWAAWITAESRLKLCRAIDAVRDTFVYSDTDSILVRVSRNTDAETTAVHVANRRGSVASGDDGNETEETREANPFPIGHGYGELKYEGRLTQFFVVAPKTYSGFDCDGKHVSAAKGIPSGDATRNALARARNGEKVSATIRTVRGIRQSIRYGKEMLFNRAFPTPDSSVHYRHEHGEFKPPRSDHNAEDLIANVRPDTAQKRAAQKQGQLYPILHGAG